MIAHPLDLSPWYPLPQANPPRRTRLHFARRSTALRWMPSEPQAPVVSPELPGITRSTSLDAMRSLCALAVCWSSTIPAMLVGNQRQLLLQPHSILTPPGVLLERNSLTSVTSRHRRPLFLASLQLLAAAHPQPRFDEEARSPRHREDGSQSNPHGLGKRRYSRRVNGIEDGGRNDARERVQEANGTEQLPRLF